MKLDPLLFSPEAIWTEGESEKERETKKTRKPEVKKKKKIICKRGKERK